MNYPNNNCGECSYWLAIGEPETTDEQNEEIVKHCQSCRHLTGRPPYVMHIPTQCCYKLEADGKTIEICGCRMQPEVDGEIFWEYTDEYIEKVVVPTDPFACHG